MSIFNILSERLILPCSDLLLGQSVAKQLKFLLNSQWQNEDELNKLQNNQLKKLVNHLYKNVPYYTKLFRNNNLGPDDFNNKDDLNKLPLLTKTIIRENFKNDSLIAKNFPKKTLMLSSSSGSTGEPLFFYTTKDAYSMNIAASLRGWYWMGYRLGDKYVKISQNPRKKLIKKIQDKLSRNMYLSSNPLTSENFHFLLTNLEKYNPKIIRCYPDPLFYLANYYGKNPNYKVTALSITTTGNTLYPEIRSTIEETFNCKIFDAYACEGNTTIFECPSHECYHSAMEYGISEVIDDSGKVITEGIGRLISTDLTNFAQPFIRYDTQDYVEVSTRPCICGRKLFRINRILGRDNDILENPHGRKFIVHNFTGFFQQDISFLKRSIDHFQVIKQKKGGLLFRLVVNSNFDSTVNDYIKSYWNNEFKDNINIEIVNEIPLTASGKRKFIINES